MNYLTHSITPELEKYFSKFDNIFKEQSQKDEFRFYGTGLLLEIKRKNIQCICNHIVDSNYQSMHHFMHDAPYDHKALNNQRIDMLENNRSTKSCCCGHVIIDDTGNPKSGDSTFGTRRQWIGSLGKVDRGQGVEQRECLYITGLYANRRVYYQLSGEPTRNEHYMKDIVTALGDDAYVEMDYVKANGDNAKAFVIDIEIKVKKLGKRRILIFKPTREEKDLEKIEVLMTNDTESDASMILRSWSFRDKIDKFYERGKDDLGFDQYQVRDEKPICRHWYMVFLMDSFLIWHRQCGSFKKWCIHACKTFGELLDVIRTKLMIHFQRWCNENPKSWHDYLLREKGIKTVTATA